MSEVSEFQSAFTSGMRKFQSDQKISKDEETTLLIRAPFYLQCITGKGDPDLPDERSELNHKAAKADVMIGHIERGVETLRDKILKATSSPPQHVLSPINRIQRNVNNPLRNKYNFRIAAIDRTLSQYPVPQNVFFYMLAGAQREKDGVVASFRESDRTFFGNEQFSEVSTIDSIVASHESVHVLQNDAALSSITTLEQARAFRAKQVFLAERKRSVINAELPAFRTELQIANYALNRALENSGDITDTKAVESLGAIRKDQQIVVETLLRLAKVFPDFADHLPEHEFPHGFVAEIIRIYRASGYQICMQDFSGNLTILG